MNQSFFILCQKNSISFDATCMARCEGIYDLLFETQMMTQINRLAYKKCEYMDDLNIELFKLKENYIWPIIIKVLNDVAIYDFLSTQLLPILFPFTNQELITFWQTIALSW